MAQLLIVEDDGVILRTLREFLEQEGFAVCCATGQAEAETLLLRGKPDLTLVDISLPDGDGYAVCARAKACGIPVIFLTASAEEHSVVRGLDMGADDYIAKPFRPRELISRIRNVLRRASPGSSLAVLGSVSVDTDRGIVKKNGCEITLSALEYRILQIFVSNRGVLLPRNKLLEYIWDIDGDFVNDNTLTVYIKRLREKIEDDPQNPTIIKTVRGLGYRVD